MKITTQFNIYPSLPIKKIKTTKDIKELLPSSFSLNNYRDISKRYDLDTDSLLYPVYKQYSCGACWAWSIASMLSDRYALVYNQKNPRFSPTPIIAGIHCKMGASEDIDLYNACDGGSSYDALILITKITQSDTPVYCDPKISKSRDDLRILFKSIDCDGYEWCESNPDCNKSLQQEESSSHLLDQFSREGSLNKLVPQFTSKCQLYRQKDKQGVEIMPTTTDKIFNLKIKRCYALEDIESIKYSLFTKGTVITNFVIFPDLIYKPDSQDKYWVETDNIYIHKKGCKIHNTSSSLDNDILLGYHSATIVGWDIKKMNRKRLYQQLNLTVKSDEPETIDIPYWIGRNTWGTNWNDGGYFKIAMTNKELGINTEVGADIPVKVKVNECYMQCGQPCEVGNDVCHIVPFGGCCAADIDTGVEEDTDIIENPDRYFIANNSIITRFVNNNVERRWIKNNKYKKYILVTFIFVFFLYLLIKKVI